jgi:hypothetical protein
MSQRAVFIEVDGMLYNEIFRSMPDYDECVSIIKDIGLDTEGSVDVVAAWYEIGEGESDTDEFFKEAELLHLYDTDTLEKEMERRGYSLMHVQTEPTHVWEEDLTEDEDE